MSAYFRKHEAFALEIMDDLEPVRLMASGKSFLVFSIDASHHS